MLWCYQAKQGPWCYQLNNPSGETRLPHSLVLPGKGADKGLRAPASCTEVSGREVSTCKGKALGRLVSKSENASRLVQCYYPTESTASLSFTQTCRPMARLRLVRPRRRKYVFCPRFCVQTAFELLLTIVHTAKFVLVRDVGRKNVGSRPSGGDRMGEPGKNLLLLLDGNYWEPYGRSRPHWPGKQKAQGLWSSLSSFTPELLLPFQEMTKQYSGDLESLFLSGHKLMEEMLPEAEFSEAVKTCWKPKSWARPQTASSDNGSCATQWSTFWRMAILGPLSP